MTPSIRQLCIVGLSGLLWAWTNLAWALPHPYFSKHPDNAKKLEALLQQTALKVLEPQPADLEIQLMDLQGKGHSLASHRGKVLMLTRWATWCGACKGEMPFKIKLAQSIASDRFALIGISSEAKDTVASYEQSAPARYPTSLLDPQELMQKFFPGGAIPVTILIDPWGWVLAMKTGGAQWDAAPYQALIRFLIALAPSKQELQKQEKAPAPKVSFARQLQVKAGQTFAVSFSLRWMGERDKYSRLLFRLPKEKGLRVLGVSTSGISEDKGGNHREYILRMKIAKPGVFQLNPILLTYWLKDYDNHFQVPIGKMEIKVAGLLGSSTSSVPSWALGTLGAAGVLFLLAIVAIRRAKTKPSEPAEEAKDKAREAALDDKIQTLLQSHNQEEWGHFLQTARSVWKEILQDKDPALNDLEEAFRYGGQAPAKDQLNAAIQHLSQALRQEYPEQASKLKTLG